GFLEGKEMYLSKRRIVGFVFFVTSACGLVASAAYHGAVRSGTGPVGQDQPAKRVATTPSVATPAYAPAFQAPPVYSVAGQQVGGAGILSVVTGDFNGDGIPDFATAGFYCANPSGDAI